MIENFEDAFEYSIPWIIEGVLAVMSNIISKEKIRLNPREK